MNQSDSEVERLNKSAALVAEANVYNLNNKYLYDSEKVFIEAWYQFPYTVFCIVSYVCMYLIINGSLTINFALIIVYGIGTLVAVANWFVFSDRIVGLYKFLLPSLITVLGIAFSIYCFYVGSWQYGILAIILAIGLGSIVSPSLYLYSIINSVQGTGMHVKYARAKQKYKCEYPFDAIKNTDHK